MQPISNDEQESPEEHAQETPQDEAGEFTINPDQVESAIKEKLDNKQVSALNRILDAGNKLIFGKDTHYQILEDLTDEDDTKLSQELGEGAANLAVVMFQKSGGTMPQELIVPAGVILLARVCEFLSRTGHPVTDDMFDESTHVFNTKLSQLADPDYQGKVQQAMGQDEQEQQMPQDQEMQQGMMQQPGQPMQQGQPQGLLRG